jgi:hypothetical protein
MPIEQRLQLLIGQQVFAIIDLTAQLEKAKERIAELERTSKSSDPV